jgi:cytosine/adenosine deaminase-related metal-dependent hydrolase
MFNLVLFNLLHVFWINSSCNCMENLGMAHGERGVEEEKVVAVATGGKEAEADKEEDDIIDGKLHLIFPSQICPHTVLDLRVNLVLDALPTENNLSYFEALTGKPLIAEARTSYHRPPGF